jgi:hypothetical protein
MFLYAIGFVLLISPFLFGYTLSTYYIELQTFVKAVGGSYDIIIVNELTT